MRTKKISPIFTLIFSSLLCAFCAGQALADDYKADDVLGYWLTEEKTAVIEMKKDDKGSYYGEIVWLKDLHTGKAKEKLDEKNPDEKLRKRSLLGLKNTWGFKHEGEGEFGDGNIYDPKSGKTYSANMELDDGGKELELRGYVGVPLFGRTTEWTREEGKVPAYIQK